MVKKQLEQPQNQSRRDFLKTSGVAAVGVPLLFSPFVQRRAYSCIIIGAGLSGLAAAHALKRQKPAWNVTVLEAREHIGGRVFSYRFDQNPELVCELGGEWVGESHERMKALCHDFGVPLKDHRSMPG
ncbi:MAG: FAD-dependent oxidoreductase [Pyrinomonadaceae bacterium]